MPDETTQPDEIHVVFPANPAREQLSALASHLRERRDAILEAWRAYGDVAPGRNIAATLSRAQFNDHIPAVLDGLGRSLESWPAQQAAVGEGATQDDIFDHGTQRWQQGYSLTELIREWGFLQVCVAAELERYAVDHPGLDPAVMPAARHAWTQMCTDGVTASATQYGRLQQTESAGHVHDLERALAALHAVDRSRAEAWRTAAHDLRGSVTVVKGAASLLNATAAERPDALRLELADMLTTSVASLHEMLNDLLSLARLDAGHEQREITTFDAAVLLRDFCTASQAAATDRGLFLKMDGPSSLPVEGDKTKILRIVQNLMLNAVKYTQRGGISVTWAIDEGRDTDRWTFSVQDTGPGIDEAHAAPFAKELHNATGVADEARELSTDRRRDMPAAETLGSSSEALPVLEQPGEGIGLSIVKRLCELLDASLELATKEGHGSTFRVILPRNYDHS